MSELDAVFAYANVVTERFTIDDHEGNIHALLEINIEELAKSFAESCYGDALITRLVERFDVHCGRIEDVRN
jgi:hypothetical protein